jgi:hypothetical protein
VEGGGGGAIVRRPPAYGRFQSSQFSISRCRSGWPNPTSRLT